MNTDSTPLLYRPSALRLISLRERQTACPPEDRTQTRAWFWLGLILWLGWTASAAAYTPLQPIPAPRILSSSEAYPGGSFPAQNLLDGKPQTEYSSNAKGTNTFLEVQFAAPVRLGAFRHVDRNDPATVAASELIFLDAKGQPTGTCAITHVNQRGGETFFVLPQPVLAQRVKWRITRLGPQGYGTVGGAELAFYEAGTAEPLPRQDRIEVRLQPFLERSGEHGLQPVRVLAHHFYAEPCAARLLAQGSDPVPVNLRPGVNAFELKLPGTGQKTRLSMALEVDGQSLAATQMDRAPVPAMTVYILPHSHTDIGYTEIQTAIEKKQVQNLLDGIAAAKRTATYPRDARFVWNVEVLWAADLYLRRLNEAQQADFLQAVKNGQVVLQGMYLNELTGLCRPEELLRLFKYATQLAARTGVPIDSVMISDVPGNTWGTVSAMAQAGLKYFSTAPNYFDRIGTILREWENRPFWWLGPDGQTKVLVWIPFWGYAMSHRYGQMSPQLVEDFCQGLANRAYPYDVAYVRWSGHGDNAIPDPAICDFVRDWNVKYAWPHFIISGTGDAFRALEKRYGQRLPIVRGDWTPYWEDGAGSSARETALNRHSSDRLSQAETLFALRQPQNYPVAAFEQAWNEVLLYSEHTWGADCSISDPEGQKTREQWDIKKGYADSADRESRSLLAKACAVPPAAGPGQLNAIDVFNTVSWSRTELVSLAPAASTAGDRVMDDRGHPVASQRLASGELVFLAENIPSLAARRFSIVPGQPWVKDRATVTGAILDNDLIHLRIDEQTGGIAELTAKNLEGNFVDTTGGETLNDYRYLQGDNLADLRRNGPITLRAGETGPLVASLIMESKAPGCRLLRREVRLVAGRDYVEIINLIDKERIQSKSYHAKEGKESVNFAFPFHVPDGQMWLDLPLGRMRPDLDQMASACKNWLTAGRFVDVSNARQGITWVTLDAPLVEVGGLTATLLNSQTNPEIWRKKIGQTQRLYSWAMNNHWDTNYRAYQEGPTIFRFILRPHRRHLPAEASRFATSWSQPLLPLTAQGAAPSSQSWLQLSSPDVLVVALKPSDDGRAFMASLFNASAKSQKVKVTLPTSKAAVLWFSDTSEQRRQKTAHHLTIPGQGVASVRIEAKD